MIEDGIDQIRACIAEALGAPEFLRLAPETVLVESGRVSSMDIVTVATALEERFGVVIPSTAVTVANFNTLQALARMVESLKAGAPAAAVVSEPEAPALLASLAACLRRPLLFVVLFAAMLVGLDLGMGLLFDGPLAGRYHAFLESGARLYPVSGGYGTNDLAFAVSQHRISSAPSASKAAARVAVFGDSGTIGSWVRPGDALPGALETELRKRYAGVLVYNLAHYMQSLHKDVSILEAVLAKSATPPFDVAVITLGDLYFNRVFGERLLANVPFLSLNGELFREYAGRLPRDTAADTASLYEEIERADAAHRNRMIAWLERNSALYHYAPYFRYATRPLSVFEEQYKVGLTPFQPDPTRPPPPGQSLSTGIPDAAFDERVVRLLDATIGLLRASGVRVVLFLKPEAPREWQSFYKRAGKRDVRDVAEAICAQQRCLVADERWVLSGAQFTDSLAHYTAGANRQLAHRLAPVVEMALHYR